MNEKELQNEMSRAKTAIVTGASRGIGRAIALKLSSEGFRLAVCCRSRSDLLEELAEEISHRGAPDPFIFIGDMGNKEDAEEFYREALKSLGHLDLLVNNAGVSHFGLLSDMGSDEWDNVMGSNLSSAFYLSRLAAANMAKRKSGRIINISSVFGESGASCEAAYSASKGAMNALTRSLAKELAPSGIQVNAIACGAIDTEMNGRLSDEERSFLEEEIPAGRFGTAEEVAKMVFLLINAPDYLNGQIINLDGAWM